MKRKINRIVSAILLALLMVTLTGSVALAYLYRAPVAISENASTDYDMVGVLWDQNNTWLANNGFMSSTANDTRVQTLGGLNKPWLVADNKTLTAIPVPADSQTNLYFVTGESEASAMDIIVGYGGYFTVSDNATIELGANFTVEQSGWIDTDNGTDKNLVYKEGAFRTYVSDTVAGNITSAILETVVSSTWISPTTATGTSWADPNNVKDENEESYASYTIPWNGTWSNYITLTRASVLCDRIRYWVTRESALVHIIDIDAWYDDNWQIVVNDGAITVGGWRTETIGTFEEITQIRVRFRNESSTPDNNLWVRFHEFDFNEAADNEVVSVTATEVPSGEHIITVTIEER